MILHSLQHDVRYIDPSISTAGDGTSPDQAYKDFPTTADKYTENMVFIVRRTSDTVPAKLPVNLTINTKSLVIWGMPKQNDGIYNLVPQEAKTDWGSDTGDYAYLYYDYGNDRDVSSIMSDNCKNFDMQHIALMSDGNHNGGSKVFRFRNRTYGCNAVIKYCWFRASKDWVANGELLGDDRWGGRWLSINEGDTVSYTRFGHRVIFTNNRIDSYSRTDTPCFNFCYSEYIEIKDIDINIVQTGTNAQVFNVGRNDYSEKAPIVFVDNVHAKYYYSDHRDCYIRTIMTFDRCAYCTIQNCSYTKSETQHWTASGNRVKFNPFIYLNLLSAGSIIKDITIDYSDVYGEAQRGVDVVYSPKYDPEDAQYGQYTKLENVTVNCCTTTAKYSDYDAYGNNENIYGGGEPTYWEYHLVCCRIDHNRDRVVSTDFLLKDLKITSPRGRAIYATHSLIDMKTMDIYGGVVLNNCMGKIGSIRTWYPGYVFYDDGGNLIHINQIICNRSNPSFPYKGQQAIIPTYRSNILVTSCNSEFMPNGVNTEGQRKCSYVCTNNNNFLGDGNYCVRNQRSFGKTWSVNRVGSYGGCSIKLYNDSQGSDWNFPLMIGGLPFKGITKNCPSAGSYIARIYATTYGYDNPEQIADRVKVRITKKDQTIISSFDGNWKLDTTSTWENIESGTAYVLEIPFTVDEAQDVEFEFEFSWEVNGGSTYLDPHPVIEKQ